MGMDLIFLKSKCLRLGIEFPHTSICWKGKAAKYCHVDLAHASINFYCEGMG